MSETKTWADTWIASQHALLQGMFPIVQRAVAPAHPLAPFQEQFDELRETWTESIKNWAQLAKDGASADAIKPEALRAMFAPERWLGSGAGAFDAGLRRVLEGPKYATLFDLDRKLLELQRLALRRDKDVATFQSVMLKGWNAAFERFAKELSFSQESAPSTWRGVADRWLSVVNDTMIDLHRTDTFVEAQRSMLRSASDYRLQERAIAEAWCDAVHVPTRTEMDEMQRTVTDLRRQLRALQRPAAPSKPTPNAAAKKKRTSSPRVRVPARA